MPKVTKGHWYTPRKLKDEEIKVGLAQREFQRRVSFARASDPYLTALTEEAIRDDVAAKYRVDKGLLVR